MPVLVATARSASAQAAVLRRTLATTRLARPKTGQAVAGEIDGPQSTPSIVITHGGLKADAIDYGTI